MEQLRLDPYKFVPARMGFPWNEDDHNILTVEEILKEDIEVELTIK
jgi:hypothetical protein